MGGADPAPRGQARNRMMQWPKTTPGLTAGAKWPPAPRARPQWQAQSPLSVNVCPATGMNAHE